MAARDSPTDRRRAQGPSWVEVDLSALQHNLRALITRCAPGTRAIAVVKADAYGHGAVPVAWAALEAGAWGLAVARVSEGVALREAGIDAPVLLMGFPAEPELPLALAHRLAVSVSGWQTALMLSALGAARGVTATIHLEVDTGMRRYGVEVEQAPRFLSALRELPCLRTEGLYTHFATADEPGSAAFETQFRVFTELVKGLETAGLRPPIVHASNSAAVAGSPRSCFDALRTGIALYGVQPRRESTVREERLDLRPAMSVKALVGRVLDVHPGDGVSYGHTFVASRPCKAAVVACGYADGYSRALSNKADVLVAGHRCRVLGRVCMDSVIVGLPEGVAVAVGDEAVLLGGQGDERVTAEELAELSGTIAYETLCGMGRRSEVLYTA